MKLDSTRALIAAQQFHAWPLPDNRETARMLAERFGEHTFFLDHHWVSIIEADDEAADGVEIARVVEVASWADEERTLLAPHPHVATSVVVTIRSSN